MTYSMTNCTSSWDRQRVLPMPWICHEGSVWGSSSLAPWPTRWMQRWHWLHCSSYRKSKWVVGYIFLFFSPVDGKVLHPKALIQIGDSFRNCINDMCNFIRDNKFNILYVNKNTFAASWSPMNSPSFIFIGPSRN